ncbi:MAG: AAA family ATPase [Cyanobacteria bacterium P01_A01_bin.105]
MYTADMTEKTYARLTELGGLLADQGYTVILDAKFDRVATRQLAIAQAQQHHLPLTIVNCQAPAEVLAQRVRERQGDIADATVAVLANQQLEPFTAPEKSYVKVVDTTQPLTTQLATIVEA